MKNYVAYFKYLVRHKWFVYLACRMLGVGFWSSIVHDLSKFHPDEWFPYMRTFYTSSGEKQYVRSADFANAWNKHQKKNNHHWQYWLLTWDNGKTEALAMSEAARKEMVADWIGAGRAITGKNETKQWYEKNKDKMILHANTRSEVEKLLDKHSN